MNFWSLALWSILCLMPLVIPPKVLWLLPLLCQLASNLLDCSSACLKFWTSAVSFIQCIFAMHFGIACLGLCILGQCVWLSRPLIGKLHSGMACLACDWLIYDWCLSKCVHCKLCCHWYTVVTTWMDN